MSRRAGLPEFFLLMEEGHWLTDQLLESLAGFSDPRLPKVLSVPGTPVCLLHGAQHQGPPRCYDMEETLTGVVQGTGGMCPDSRRGGRRDPISACPLHMCLPCTWGFQTQRTLLRSKAVLVQATPGHCARPFPSGPLCLSSGRLGPAADPRAPGFISPDQRQRLGAGMYASLGALHLLKITCVSFSALSLLGLTALPSS